MNDWDFAAYQKERNKVAVGLVGIIFLTGLLLASFVGYFG